MLTQHTKKLVALTETFPPDMQAVMQTGNEIANAAPAASSDEKNTCVTLLKMPIADSHVMVSAIVSVMAGAIVESGADPEIAIEAILARLKAMLPDVKHYVEMCLERELDPHTSMATLGPEIPLAVDSWQAYNYVYRAVIAMTSRSQKARRQLSDDKTLVETLASLREYGEGTEYLYKMARVLDGETLIVLHPDLKKGYRLQIAGIADNFQLHTLLADALIGADAEGWIPLEQRPSSELIKVMRGEAENTGSIAQGYFNLYNWFALEPDGTLDSDMAYKKQAWVWNEGIPGDIMPFEGQRIVLLGPPSYTRTWNGQRLFDGMRADLTVLEQLSATAVTDWLIKLQANTISIDRLSQ